MKRQLTVVIKNKIDALKIKKKNSSNDEESSEQEINDSKDEIAQNVISQYHQELEKDMLLDSKNHRKCNK